MSDLAAALQVAIRVHAAQVDKQREPYLLHVLRVVEAVSDEAKVVAALHDVVETAIEDGRGTADGIHDVTEADVLLEEFAAILALTRDAGAAPGHETYATYIEHVASAGPIAREVKLADLRDNLGRIPPEPPGVSSYGFELARWHGEWGSLKRRYEKAIATLESAGGTHA